MNPRWMRAVSKWCPGKAEEELIAELSATTTTPPGRRMDTDPRRHGVYQQALSDLTKRPAVEHPVGAMCNSSSK